MFPGRRFRSKKKSWKGRPHPSVQTRQDNQEGFGQWCLATGHDSTTHRDTVGNDTKAELDRIEGSLRDTAIKGKVVERERCSAGIRRPDVEEGIDEDV
jgi:hypothetical protein